MQLQTPQGSPPWNDGVEQRLFVSMLLASLLIAGALSLFRMPSIPAWSPVVELMVRIVEKAPSETPETQTRVSPEAVVTPSQEQSEVARESAPTMGQDVLEENRQGVDWDAASEQAVREYVDSQEESYAYFNPELAEKRRSLSGQYQPRTRPLPKPIWENVEIDTLGRTVLRSGNCYKVLDDPNVGSREAFERFGQFIAVCTWQPHVYTPLPFVDDIRKRYEYLRNTQGYVKDEPEE